MGRLTLFAVLAVICAPVLIPYYLVLRDPSALAIWSESDRLLGLLGNTVELTALTLAWALPPGILMAFALTGGSPGGRSWLRALMFLSLAIPLPVTTVAWHAVRLGRWTPFSSGLLPAAALHALAGVPWVALIVAVGLATVDPSVRDDARLHTGPFRRGLRVDLPPSFGFVILAGLWLASQTSVEIVITDMLQVRTFAEEVYTQAVAPAAESAFDADAAVARAVAATLPLPLILAGGFLLSARGIHVGTDLGWRAAGGERTNRWALFLGALSVVVPVGLLCLRCGSPMSRFLPTLIRAAGNNAEMLGWSIAAAAAVGVGVSLWVGCAIWLTRGAPFCRGAIVCLGAIAVAVPGPIIGLGVRANIDWLLTKEQRWHGTMLADLLYNGTSLAPVMWVWAIRALPLALAIWLPAVARLRNPYGEATRLETASRLAFLRHELMPVLSRPFAIAAGLVAALSLGEVSASHLVSTPGGESFAHNVFARMHYGITPDLAGMCLVLLLPVTICVAAASWMAEARQTKSAS